MPQNNIVRAGATARLTQAVVIQGVTKLRPDDIVQVIETLTDDDGKAKARVTFGGRTYKVLMEKLEAVSTVTTFQASYQGRTVTVTKDGDTYTVPGLGRGTARDVGAVRQADGSYTGTYQGVKYKAVKSDGIWMVSKVTPPRMPRVGEVWRNTASGKLYGAVQASRDGDVRLVGQNGVPYSANSAFGSIGAAGWAYAYPSVSAALR